MEWNNFSDFQKQDFKSEKELAKYLNETIEILKDNKNDWKKRETLIKSIGSISLGNQAQSKTFLKYFNEKICFCFQIQILDLRSSLMKDACRALVLCAKNLGNLAEPALEKLFSANVLFKVINSANKLISEAGVRTVKKIIKNLESEKILVKILEQLKSKGSQIKLACVKALVVALKYYSESCFFPIMNALEEFIRCMVHDANGEVRLFARRLFLVFREVFPLNAEKVFGLFELALQKAVIEDMKKFNVAENSSSGAESEGNGSDFDKEEMNDKNVKVNYSNENKIYDNKVGFESGKNHVCDSGSNKEVSKKLSKLVNYIDDVNVINNNNYDFDFNKAGEDKTLDTNYSNLSTNNYNYNNNYNNNRKTEGKSSNTNSPMKSNNNYVKTNARNSIYIFNEDENATGNFNYMQTESLINKVKVNDFNKSPERRSSYNQNNFIQKNSKTQNDYNLNEPNFNNNNNKYNKEIKSKNPIANINLEKQEIRKSSYLEEQIVLLKNNDIIQNSKYFKDLYKQENSSKFSNANNKFEEIPGQNSSNNYINDFSQKNNQQRNLENNKNLNSSLYSKNLTNAGNNNINNNSENSIQKSLNNENKNSVSTNNNNNIYFNKLPQQVVNKSIQRSAAAKSNSGTPSKITKTKLNQNQPNNINLNTLNDKNINSKNQALAAEKTKGTNNLANNNYNYNNVANISNYNNQVNETEENLFLKKGYNRKDLLTPSNYSKQTAITENYNNLGKNFEIDEVINKNLEKININYNNIDNNENFEFYNYVNNNNNNQNNFGIEANSLNNKKFAFIPKGKTLAKNAMENSKYQKGNDLLLETETEIKRDLNNNNNNVNIPNQRFSLNNTFFENKNESNLRSFLIPTNTSENQTRYSLLNNNKINNNYPSKPSNNPINPSNTNIIFKTKSQNIESNISDILKQLQEAAANIQTKIKLLENVSLIFNEIYSNIDTLNKPLIKSLIDFHIANYNTNLSSAVYFNFADLLSSEINSNNNPNIPNNIKNIKGFDKPNDLFSYKNNELIKKFLIEIIKNLSKFIFYLTSFFSNENFVFLIKISILHSIKLPELEPSAQALLDIIKSKVDSLIFFKAVFQLVDAEASDEILNKAFDFVIPFIPNVQAFFKSEKNLFQFSMKLIELLKSGNFEANSTIKFKILDAFEALYDNFPVEFVLVYENYLEQDCKNFLDFHLQKNKSVFYQKLKSNNLNQKAKGNKEPFSILDDKRFTYNEKNFSNEETSFVNNDKNNNKNKNDEEEFYKKSFTNHQPRTFSNNLVNVNSVNSKIDRLLDEGGRSDSLNKNTLDFLNKNLNLFSNPEASKNINDNIPKVVEFDLFNDSVEGYSSKHVTSKVSNSSVVNNKIDRSSINNKNNNNNNQNQNKNGPAVNKRDSISNTSINKIIIDSNDYKNNINKNNNNKNDNYNYIEFSNSNTANAKNNLRNSIQNNIKYNINHKNNIISSNNNINNDNKNNNNNYNNKSIKPEGEIISMLHAGEYAYFLYFISSNPEKNIKDFLSQINEIKLNQVDKIVSFLHDSLRDADYAYLYNFSLESLIEKIIFIYEKFFDEEINDDFKDLFTSLSHFCDADLYIQFSAKQLNFKKSNSLILIILQTMKNSIIKIEAEKLLLLLPTFIDKLFEFLTHHTSDVRKLAVLCAVEIYFILGEDFEEYLGYANQSQRNLINIFYKKKQQDKKI